MGKPIAMTDNILKKANFPPFFGRKRLTGLTLDGGSAIISMSMLTARPFQVGVEKQE
jgi:hypothetical protein